MLGRIDETESNKKLNEFGALAVVPRAAIQTQSNEHEKDIQQGLKSLRSVNSEVALLDREIRKEKEELGGDFERDSSLPQVGGTKRSVQNQVHVGGYRDKVLTTMSEKATIESDLNSMRALGIQIPETELEHSVRDSLIHSTNFAQDAKPSLVSSAKSAVHAVKKVITSPANYAEIVDANEQRRTIHALAHLRLKTANNFRQFESSHSNQGNIAFASKSKDVRFVRTKNKILDLGIVEGGKTKFRMAADAHKGKKAHVSMERDKQLHSSEFERVLSSPPNAAYPNIVEGTIIKNAVHRILAKAIKKIQERKEATEEKHAERLLRLAERSKALEALRAHSTSPSIHVFRERVSAKAGVKQPLSGATQDSAQKSLESDLRLLRKFRKPLEAQEVAAAKAAAKARLARRQLQYDSYVEARAAELSRRKKWKDMMEARDEKKESIDIAEARRAAERIKERMEHERQRLAIKAARELLLEKQRHKFREETISEQKALEAKKAKEEGAELGREEQRMAALHQQALADMARVKQHEHAAAKALAVQHSKWAAEERLRQQRRQASIARRRAAYAAAQSRRETFRIVEEELLKAKRRELSDLERAAALARAGKPALAAVGAAGGAGLVWGGQRRKGGGAARGVEEESTADIRRDYHAARLAAVKAAAAERAARRRLQVARSREILGLAAGPAGVRQVGIAREDLRRAEGEAAKGAARVLALEHKLFESEAPG